MTPVELQQALAKTPARSAQILAHRLLEDRTREACATLYGLTLPQWDQLFRGAAHDFERALGRTPAEGEPLPEQLTPELRALGEHRDALKQLMAKAQTDYEASPSFTLEVWARRIAILLIVALTAYFYWRQEQTKKPIPYAPYLTQPKRP